MENGDCPTCYHYGQDDCAAHDGKPYQENPLEEINRLRMLRGYTPLKELP